MIQPVRTIPDAIVYTPIALLTVWTWHLWLHSRRWASVMWLVLWSDCPSSFLHPKHQKKLEEAIQSQIWSVEAQRSLQNKMDWMNWRSRSYQETLLLHCCLFLRTFQLKVLACGLLTPDLVTDASTLLLVITRTEFIIALVFTNECLKYHRGLKRAFKRRRYSSGTVWDQDFDIIPQASQREYCRWSETVPRMCDEVGITPSIPRTCGRQHYRASIPASNPPEYLRRIITFQFWTIFILSLKVV